MILKAFWRGNNESYAKVFGLFDKFAAFRPFCLQLCAGPCFISGIQYSFSVDFDGYFGFNASFFNSFYK